MLREWPLVKIPVKSLPFGPELAPMEAASAEALPVGSGWSYEPKWDGFRCIARRRGDEVDLRAKSGKTLSRFFPDVVAALLAVPFDLFVIDGELVIPVEDLLSFDTLQMRLHPAESRIRKLADAQPARLILFDLLVDVDGTSLLDQPLLRRRAALERFVARAGSAMLRLSPRTEDRAEAEAWLSRVGHATDGVMAKRIDSPYEPGERTMVKVKNLRTADCVVAGYRPEAKSNRVGSLLLGLYNDQGQLDHVGYTSSIAEKDRAALTKRLDALRGGPGFDGKAPGGPSRWSTKATSTYVALRPELVVEVRYDHVTGQRFRHGTSLVRWRPDKAPHQCTFVQLAPPRPA
jgi:ATP-dependent DNA ligase